jgi:hypothetical protein
VPVGPSCVDSVCVGDLGFPTEFSSCADASVGLDLNTLYVEPVTIPNGVVVTALGVFADEPQGDMGGLLALYSTSVELQAAWSRTRR